MGMNSNVDYISGATSARSAIDTLVSEDVAEYGYSHSWRVYDLRELPGPMHLDLAQREVIKRLDAHVEGAYAVAVYHQDDVETRTVEVAGTIDGEAWADYDTRSQALWALATQKVRLRAGETITDVRIATREVPRAGLYPHREQQVARTVKVEVEAPKEATETRYFVTHEHTTMRDLAWENGHPTQAAARKALTEALKSGRTKHTAYDVIGIARRVSGAPLVTARRTVTKAVVTLKVSICKAKKNARTDGYVVGGWYHS